jgi:hypothetical protein
MILNHMMRRIIMMNNNHFVYTVFVEWSDNYCVPGFES